MAVLALESPLAAVPLPADPGPRTLLTIRSDPPGAAVFQEGAWIGTTPLVDVPAVAGKTVLRLLHPERGELSLPIEVKPFDRLDAGSLPLPRGATLDLTGLRADVQAACDGRRLAGKAVVRPAGARLLLAKRDCWTQVQDLRVPTGAEEKVAPGAWEPAPEWKEAAVAGLPAPPKSPVAPPDLWPGFRTEGGRIWCEKDRAEMVPASPRRIPAPNPGEKAQSFPALLVDRHEVTVSQFSRFLQALSRPVPRKFAAGVGKYPVTGVALEEASEYAAWAGKRLPTDAEWTWIAAPAAAAGEPAWPFPWGPVDSPAARNLAGTEDTEARMAAVGKYLPGMTPIGLFDILGNAAEMCSDGIARGGSWAAARAGESTRPGAEGDPATGFRCVASSPFPASHVVAWRLLPETAHWPDAKVAPVLPAGGVAEIVKGLRGKPAFSSQSSTVDLNVRVPEPTNQRAAYLLAILRCPAEARLRMVTGADDGLRIWLNEQSVLERIQSASPDMVRTDVTLVTGDNTLLAEISNVTGPWYFSIRFEGLNGVPWAVHADGTLRPAR